MERRFGGKGWTRRLLCLSTATAVSLAGWATLGHQGTPAVAADQASAPVLQTNSIALHTPATSCPAQQLVVPALAVTGIVGAPRCLPVSEPTGESRIDLRYSHAATQLIAAYAQFADVEPSEALVVCWSREDWYALDEWFVDNKGYEIRRRFGFVQIPHTVINLSPDVCDYLDELAYEGFRDENRAVASAVGVLAHEAMHVAGVRDERTAECRGLELTALAAVALGASDAYGNRLQEIHAGFNAEYRIGTDYDTSQCEVA